MQEHRNGYGAQVKAPTEFAADFYLRAAGAACRSVGLLGVPAGSMCPVSWSLECCMLKPTKIPTIIKPIITTITLAAFPAPGGGDSRSAGMNIPYL